jgi:hypothetical protein
MNKIELIIPRITNLEWNKLCLDRQFNNFILEDLSKASKRAESILGKPIEVKKDNKNFSNPS